MDSLRSRLAYLLSNYHNKNITEQESKELAQLINQASDDELTSFLHKEWEDTQMQEPVFADSKSNAILEHILQAKNQRSHVTSNKGIIPINKQRKYMAFERVAAAAAILILVGFGIYFGVRSTPDNEKTIATHQFGGDALPGGNKAMLTLSNGETILLDTARNGILTKQGSINVNKAKDGQLVYTVAGNVANENITFNTLSTPRGGQYQIVLPDGSKVWLNAASSLKFPAVFKGKERKVFLTGEGYFEIAKNPTMPFIVKSGDAEVKVLGTHFNIMAYDDENVLKTTLLEGSVKITSNSVVNVLEPGEQAVVKPNGHMSVLNSVDVNEAVAWKNGLFHFNDTDLQTIMRSAARWYDLEIKYEGEIPERHFAGRISRNVKASEFLSILEYTGVNFRIQGKTIIVMN